MKKVDHKTAAQLALVQVQAKPEPEQGAENDYVAITLNIPVDLLDKLRTAAGRRATRARKGRPSVASIVSEILRKHEAEIDAIIDGRA